MGGGTEAFPELGSHCQNPECRQLDFLPFTCNACRLVFCLEHRSYKSHSCPNSYSDSRKVIVCETCSSAIETTGRDDNDEKEILKRHEKSGDCDPRKKKRETCPVKKCREVLTFSNKAECKSCGIRVCLKHRFPGDHVCSGGDKGNKFLVALAGRSGKDCVEKKNKIVGSSSSVRGRSVGAY